MQLIKKIISWLISLFRIIFKKQEKNNKKSSLNNKKMVKNNNKIKNITSEINETMPSYMFLSNREKELLIERIKEIKKIINKKNNEYLNQEILEITNMLDECITKNSTSLKEEIISFKNSLSKGISKTTDKEINLLLNLIPINKKEDIVLKYNSISDNDNLVKKSIAKIDEVIADIEKRNVTILEKNQLMETCDNFNYSKDNNLVLDISNCSKDMLYVMTNINKNIIDKVKLDYKKINYITLSTELLDEIGNKLKKIENDYHSHLYNKYYYEREINKIKEQIRQLKELKNKPAVFNEILELRKELYTKSKDKYDILYNNEVFININKKCDDLISKVNAKVVDIKKENTKKDDSKKKDEYLENIIKRFQDMKMAREIILDNNKIEFKNDKEMILYIKNMYNGFTINEVNNFFNFERNKEKTELVLLFNSLNKVNCHLNKEDFIPIEHINFKMVDLLEAVSYKKEELSETMKKKYNIDIKDQLVEDKLNNMILTEKNNSKVLIKQKNKK